MQHQAFKFGHIGKGDALAFIEMRQRAQHPAHGVAQFAIGLDEGLQDFAPDAQIVGIIGRGHPQAQNIGARILDDGLRRNDIADRFGHLLPLLVEHEAVGQNHVVGRTPARAAALQQG